MQTGVCTPGNLPLTVLLGVGCTDAAHGGRHRPGRKRISLHGEQIDSSSQFFVGTSMSFLTHLECTRCGRTFDADRLQGACPDDGRPLYARYDLEAMGRVLRREEIAG